MTDAATAASTPDALSRLVVSHAKTRKFEGNGLRKFLEYADLGVSEATDGRMRVRVARRLAGNPSEASGRHYHVLDAQLVFVLQGRVKVDFDGLGEVWLEAGDFSYIPPGLIHAESDMSDDYVVLAVSMPADFDTVHLETPAS